MCKENREYFFILLLVVLLSCVAGVLRAQEQPDQWYLILESELQTIEAFKKNSEAEKQTWRSQAIELKAQANFLRRESKHLNAQLANQRNLNKTLTESFNRYEHERLQILSLKNGEIASLNQVAAERTLETERYRRKSLAHLIVAMVLGAAWLLFIALKMYRFFRPKL